VGDGSGLTGLPVAGVPSVNDITQAVTIAVGSDLTISTNVGTGTLTLDYAPTVPAVHLIDSTNITVLADASKPSQVAYIAADSVLSSESLSNTNAPYSVRLYLDHSTGSVTINTNTLRYVGNVSNMVDTNTWNHFVVDFVPQGLPIFYKVPLP